MAHPFGHDRRRYERSRRRRRWGGKRRGAGRPTKAPRSRVPHTRRDAFDRTSPVHVTLRVMPHVWNLRARRTMKRIRKSFSASNAKGMMRIVHFSVQGNHIHFVAEAVDSSALSRAVQGLCVRIARSLNAMMDRTGTVFADRYHARLLTSLTQVRNTLAYVLNNRRRHDAAAGLPLPDPTWIDPCSSGAWFDGWSDRAAEPPPQDGSVVEATLWVLRVGWKRRGLIDVAFVPGGGARALGA